MPRPWWQGWWGLRGPLLLALACVLLVPVQVWTEVHLTTTAPVRLTSPKLAPGSRLRVVQVADVHAVDDVAQLDRIVARVRGLHPDVIALTGDFVHDETSDLTDVEHLVAGLSGTGARVFYVWGNHDHWNRQRPWGGRADLRGMLGRLGVEVLENEAVAVEGAFGTIDVVGTDDPSDGLADLPAALAGTSPARYRLLLTHSPEIAPALPGSGVDLALCGHTHGGQVRAPFVGAVMAPNQGWWPHFSRGMYDEFDGPLLWIDSGVGWTARPWRFMTPSQISVLDVAGR